MTAAQLEALVGAAVGANAERGDRVEVVASKFEPANLEPRPLSMNSRGLRLVLLRLRARAFDVACAARLLRGGCGPWSASFRCELRTGQDGGHAGLPPARWTPHKRSKIFARRKLSKKTGGRG